MFSCRYLSQNKSLLIGLNLKIRDSTMMGNMATNVCATFKYDRFHIDKALENFRKSNNKHKHIRTSTRRRRRTFAALGDPFRVQITIRKE